MPIIDGAAVVCPVRAWSLRQAHKRDVSGHTLYHTSTEWFKLKQVLVAEGVQLVH